jgi:hypothetical protein
MVIPLSSSPDAADVLHPAFVLNNALGACSTAGREGQHRHRPEIQLVEQNGNALPMRCSPSVGGLGLLEKADRFNAAEARVRMVCGECQRIRQFYLASMAEASALGMTASRDLSGS